MKLKTRNLKYQKLAVRQTCAREESVDGIVPDTQPDIARIVDVSAMVFARDRELGQDSVNIRCNAKADVIYTSDEDNTLYHVEIPLSFAHRAELRGAVPGDDILTRTWVQSCDARMINTRKISVRINAAFENSLYKQADDTIVEGIEDDKVWCVKTEDLDFSEVKAVTFKNFTLAEDLTLTDEEAPLKNIASSDLSLRAGEVKVASNRVMVQGDAVYSALCLAEDGTKYAVHKAFSFNQSCDIPGVEESDSCSIHFELRNFEAIPAVDVSGSQRYISINAGICMNIEVQNSIHTVILEDVYGIKNECSVEKGVITYRKLCENKIVDIKGEAKCENNNIKSILFARYVPERNPEYDADNDSGNIYGTIQYLYENNDGEIEGAQLKTKDVFMSDHENAHVDIYSDPVSWQYRDGVCRFTYDVELVIQNDPLVNREYITQITEGEPYKPDRYSDLSAVLRRAAEGENLWDIARNYRTTTQSIASANGLDSDECLASEKLLLIPIERV